MIENILNFSIIISLTIILIKNNKIMHYTHNIYRLTLDDTYWNIKI